MEHYVADKVVVITGGSSGFGLEAARLLLEMGSRVVITGRSGERLEAAATDLGGGDALLAIPADACAVGDWEAVVAGTLARFGRLDVLVLNHGAGVELAATEELTDELIATVLDINLASVFKGARAVLPTMKKQGAGHIVTVSSACAYHSWPTWGVYTAAKAGLVAYTRCLHVEMAEWGGKASSFIPGAARTNFCAAAHIDTSWQEGYPGAAEFARTLVHCIDVPENCFIEEVNIWGTAQVPAMVNPF